MRYWPVYGGGETITVSLANELVKRGHEVYILYTHYKDCDPMPYLLDSRIKQHKLHTIENFTPNDVKIFHDFLDANHIDVMVNQWGATQLCDDARKGLKTKLVTCWHLDVVRQEYPNTVKGKLLRFVLGKKIYQRRRFALQMRNHLVNFDLSDRYVFLSKSFEKHYRELANIQNDEGKLDSISNPLTYDFVFNKDGLSKKKKQVLFVGRMYEYHKRISYALNIWKQIEKDPEFSDWTFKLVGDGPDLQSSIEIAKSLDLKRTSFEGFKNPRPYYDESAIFVMTSAFEGFGMTLVEAQQYGVVPMAMDTYKSLHDIIENGKNGLIITDNDLDGYAKKLKHLMQNENERNQLAIAALDSCNVFRVQSVVDRWEKLFKQIVS